MADDPTMETSGQGGNESAIASDPGEVLRGLSPEQLGDVVSLVLEKRSEFRNAHVGQILNESIRRFITVDGFRDSSKAHNQQKVEDAGALQCPRAFSRIAHSRSAR